MTTFVLRTDEEDDLGFLLFASHDGEWPPAGAHNCVLSGSPYEKALLDDPRGRFVLDNKGEEFTAEISYGPDEMRVQFATGSGWRFELKSAAAGNEWSAVRAAERIGGTGAFL